MIRELESALDSLALRQRTVSNNLANLNTPGYTRSDVDFYSHMKQIFAGGKTPAEATEDRDSPVRLDGNNTSIERETYSLVQTDVLYQTAAKFTTYELQRLKTAITEGR